MLSAQLNTTGRIMLRKLTEGDTPKIPRGRRVEGLIVDGVTLGRPMVVFYGHGCCIITTPVQRILGAVGDCRQFVATENSTYELRPLT
jgi:hypothetical protein